MEKATFATWVENDEGGYSRGVDVHVLEEVYLTTDLNTTKRDNLDSLPEF